MSDRWSEQTTFNRAVVDWGVVGFFDQPITLKSGRQSFWYVNWRSVAEDVYRLDKASDFIVHYGHFLLNSGKVAGIDTIFGVPEGASKYALLAQYKMARDSDFYSEGSHVMAMGRGKRKEHGDPKDRFLLGLPRGRTLIVEDVTTTGGSLIDSVNLLEECGVDVVGAVALTNREDGAENVRTILGERQKPVPYFAMSRGTDLLPLIVKKMEDEGKEISPGAKDEVARLVG